MHIVLFRIVNDKGTSLNAKIINNMNIYEYAQKAIYKIPICSPFLKLNPTTLLCTLYDLKKEQFR